MAEVIDQSEWPERAPIWNARYPWSEWFDGELWRLRRGRDFDVDPEAFRSAVSGSARRRGLRVTTRVVGNEVFVRSLGER